ncbi:ABC transporter ATP-binding protein [Kroppenstedtia pulmonis]|uniref:ABC transporter ATP-binding protein n=1 Tax=Kroppenstedtia pulmonis TaxID=1380685 RepID=A0A7D4BE14_9BACL|nr:ABC transporter ATP-binding protein [Kroppenstedtia pulmonis]QKG83192.1 ABC transporter ATP-binding protein [Kroppenstedtia pulmonis]
MASVQMKHISKHYGDVAAVSDFHLEVQDQEFLVLVGPSGCGKSTTLRIVAGLEEVTSGKVYIGGQLVNNVPSRDRDIAMVFQNYALFPHMSVFQNMAFALKMYRFKKNQIDKQVRQVARNLNIDHLLDRKPATLSGGERQRVALGRAIVRKPQVFLMDEPLSNLDAKLRAQMRTEIRKLHQYMKTTVIYVTHDQTEAMTMGDRIVVMREGVIQQADVPRRIYQKPANVFVAGFIGSPAMNFIQGRLWEKDGYLRFQGMGIDIRIPDKSGKTLKKKAYVGKNVILGVRPEDIRNDPLFLESSPDSHLTAKVEWVEYMGSENYAYLSGISEKWVTAKVDAGTSVIAGKNIKVALDMNHVHIFDKETEKALS